MVRPRKPFGTNQPGRLQSTMMKVLAAEMSDPQRSRKGKRYAADGSVLDIVVEPGIVTVEVQGTRATPYVATLEVSPGDGMPLRRDLHATCSCPDDEGWSDRICKHVVALMYVFADELLIEPELLDVWRGNETVEAEERSDGDDPEDDAAPIDHGADDTGGRDRRRRHLRLVRDGVDEARRERERAPAAKVSPPPDPIAHVLGVPEGRTIPVVPVLEPADVPLPRRPELAALLRDALREIRVDWD